MKKSRPAVQLNVLCDTTDKNKVEQILLKETTSLGLRYSYVTKSMLERKSRTVETPYGPIRVKEGLFEGKVIKYKPEHDDCVRIAGEAGVPLREVYSEVDKCINALIQKK